MRRSARAAARRTRRRGRARAGTPRTGRGRSRAASGSAPAPRWRGRLSPTRSSGLAEHLVERVDVGLLVAGRSLDRHLQGPLGLVVVLATRTVTVAGVHED